MEGFGGFATPNSLDKKKGKVALMAIFVDKRFRTDMNREATFRGNAMLVGVKPGDKPLPVVAPTLTDAKIS